MIECIAIRMTCLPCRLQHFARVDHLRRSHAIDAFADPKPCCLLACACLLAGSAAGPGHRAACRATTTSPTSATCGACPSQWTCCRTCRSPSRAWPGSGCLWRVPRARASSNVQRAMAVAVLRRPAADGRRLDLVPLAARRRGPGDRPRRHGASHLPACWGWRPPAGSANAPAPLLGLAVLLLLAGRQRRLWSSTGNVLPWAALQFGGMALLLWLALAAPAARRAGRALGLGDRLPTRRPSCSKLDDHAIFELTGQLVSGHTLKHWSRRSPPAGDRCAGGPCAKPGQNPAAAAHGAPGGVPHEHEQR